jgi:hypothetical protein
MNNKRTRMLAIANLFILIMGIPVFYAIRSMTIDTQINDRITKLYSDATLAEEVMLKDTPTVTQSKTCGYAAIQWVTGYLGKEVKELEIYDMNSGKITTNTTKGFGKELSKQLGKSYKVTTLSNASNREILKSMNKSLKKGMPVPISFAAEDNRNRPNYTIHFSIVTGMDMKNDKIYVSNVYGYEEVYSVPDFLEALKFNNYRKKPVFIRAGIFFARFDRNTIYIIERN